MQKLVYKNKVYKNIDSLCSTFCKNQKNVVKCLKLNASLDEAMQVPNDLNLRQITEIITYDNNIFYNKRMLLHHYGIRKCKIEYLQARYGLSFLQCVDAIRFPKSRIVHTKQYKVFGKSYPNLKAIARDFGINYNTLHTKVKHGNIPVEIAINHILTKYRKPTSRYNITINGVVYKNRQQAANHLNVTKYAIYKILQKRAFLDEKGRVVYPNRHAVEIDGKVYSSLKEASFSLGISRNILTKCLKNNIHDSGIILNKRLRTQKLKSKGVLYKITNKFSGKVYIGISLVSAPGRFKSHMKRAKLNKSSPMYEDYHKYGENSFTLRVLKEANALKLKKLEIYYINTKYKCRVPNGYNIAIGGTLPDSDLLSKQAFRYKGVLYKSHRHLCKCLNLSYKKFMSYIRKGYTVRQCVNRVVKWNKMSVYERRVITNKSRTKYFIVLPKLGKVSLKEGCEKYGIRYDNVVSFMLKNKIPAHQAFNQYLGLVDPKLVDYY